MHSDPLYEALNGDKCRADPAAILSGVMSGRYDAGMISLLEYFRNMKTLQIIESANIHSTGSTLSTLVVSRKHSLSACRTLGITKSTETTSWYASRILRDLGFRPEIKKTDATEAEKILSEFDAALVIGDEALRVFHTNLNILMDVGYEYTALYRRPPVFAVTVSRKGEHHDGIKADLDSAISGSSAYLDKFSYENSKRLEISVRIMKSYYYSIRYNFDEAVRLSIEIERDIFLSENRSA